MWPAPPQAFPLTLAPDRFCGTRSKKFSKLLQFQQRSECADDWSGVSVYAFTANASEGHPILLLLTCLHLMYDSPFPLHSYMRGKLGKCTRNKYDVVF